MVQKRLNITEPETSDKIIFHFAKTEADIETLKEVINKYPVKYTHSLLKLFKNSEAVRKQFLPSMSEIKTNGTPTPFEEGKKASKTYGLERLYRDRVLITPNFDCPVYCRFCYKKSRVMRNKRRMTYDEIDKVVNEVSNMDQVRGALITGGEPFLDIKKLFYLLDKLNTLDNITEIRIATRTLLTLPHIYTDDLCFKLSSYNQINFNNPEKSKYLAINVHFNHPDELVPEVMEACNKLTSRGITLRNQTVLLKGINDNIETMTHLFKLLIRNNIIPYYINHCMPVEGSDHLRTSVQKGLDIYQYLCTESSTAIPHYVYAPSGGKVHVGPDTKFEYIYQNGIRYIKVKTLYKADEFKEIAKKDLPPMHEVTNDGYIQGLYIDGYDD
ncbi:MAG: radical SAM protein [Bacteroidales bacterium]|nr:radical SAM protein [Bacteroidales bacterium]